MSLASFRVIIRADAGAVTGTGHVMRMMALGQALLGRGTAVIFVVAHCPEALIGRLHAEGFVVEQLRGCEPGGSDDARRTTSLAVAQKARWIILDGYGFDTEYQTTCRQAGRRVLCVDDHRHGDRWDVDVLLNQNLHSSALRDEYMNAANRAELLLGNEFALLRREFWGRPHSFSPHEGEARRVLITMGGSDPPNATALIMGALEMIRSLPLQVFVLVGAGNSHRHQLESIASQHPNRFVIMDGVERMSSLFARMDAVITAGGSTCWEVLWAGKPAAVMVIAENQQPIADSLQEQGVMLTLGRFQDASANQLAGKLEHWLQALPTPSTACRVDGKGARRVAAILDGRFSITLATAGEGWLRAQLDALKSSLEAAGHRVHFASKAEEMTGGDFLFLLSYWGVVSAAVLDRYLHSLVVHASDLPNGRGWSPATWRILEGGNQLPICLLEASEKVDRGDVYIRDSIDLDGHELIAEWRELVSRKTTELCLRFVNSYPAVLAARERQPEEGTYYPRRTPVDSRLDISRTISQLFNQLRVSDNEAYPAWFDHLGHRYLLKIEKASP